MLHCWKPIGAFHTHKWFATEVWTWYLKPESRNWKSQYGYQAAILKVTSLKFNKSFPWPQTICIWNFKSKFQTNSSHVSRTMPPTESRYWKKQNNMASMQPFWKWHGWKSIGFFPYSHVMCQWSWDMIFKAKLKLQSGNKKSNIAARRPFWKWRRWKSTGLFPYTQVMCYWSLALIFKDKLKLESRNWKIQYGHFESDVFETLQVLAHGQKLHAYKIWNWNSKANLSYTPEKNATYRVRP